MHTRASSARAALQLNLELFESDLPDPQQTLDPEPNPGFGKLPLELRLMIWQHCFPPPRKVVFTDRHCSDDTFQPGWQPPLLPKNTIVPITLSICQESRSETLKHYHVVGCKPYRVLDNTTVPATRLIRRSGGFIFSPKRDTAVVSMSLEVHGAEEGQIMMCNLFHHWGASLNMWYPGINEAIERIEITRLHAPIWTWEWELNEPAFGQKMAESVRRRFWKGMKCLPNCMEVVPSKAWVKHANKPEEDGSKTDPTYVKLTCEMMRDYTERAKVEKSR